MQKETEKPQKIYLKDYQPPAFAVEQIHLDFILNEESSRVVNTMNVRGTGSAKDLFLNGEDLNLVSVRLDGRNPKFEVSSKGLTIFDVPAQFQLEIATETKPQENTSLEGLYKSNGVFCTQCEAQGFRKITYFLDRPDVMTTYTVRIEADEKKYPVLLSNGDRISRKSLGNGRHEVVWRDPHKKPCYLFALVAGELGVIRDVFRTKSGKKVDLEIYAAPGLQDRCYHAMDSLKKSMKWDEDRFGREYDLSVYMILAVDDFNAGAMENKGLNIFNSRLVFANPETATDADYFGIESVIAHEYFHNWTGNRVTLRDWFHLSLKEGLTVFRDQEFSMDQSSRALIRIDNVDDLRSSQFAEDAGPNAHPIRPASCFAVDNFFTGTIYEKGSEVIRMMQTMVGRPGFRQGMDLYFERFDGQAVVIEDFAKAIADPNQQDWSQFKLWYSQAGTPRVSASEIYNSEKQQYTLTLHQECPPTPQEKIDGVEKKPFHIPLVIGLLNSKTGQELPLQSNQTTVNSEGQVLIHLKQQTESFVFENVPEKPVLSLNRQFSAPIHLRWIDKSESQQFEENIFLMKNDTDSFNRWESTQKIYQNAFHELIREYQTKVLANSESPAGSRSLVSLTVPTDVVSAFSSLLHDENLDADLKAKLISLPELNYIAQLEKVLDAKAFLAASETLGRSLAQANESQLQSIYQALHGKNVFSLDPKDFGRRRLKNKALSYLSYLDGYDSLALQQMKQAEIMTDQQAGLAILVDLDSPLRNEAIAWFFDRWKKDSLVLNKWFALQAMSSHSDTFETVQKLLEHPDFNMKNPNRVYSLLRTFGANISQFHRDDLETYAFMADQILILDKLNPQVAARVATCFDVWKKLPPRGQQKAHQQLERLVRHGLSGNTHEILSKSLQA